MLYLYESHMGGLYWSENNYSYDELYCDTCGDADMQIGSAETYRDVVSLLDAQEDRYIDVHIFELASEAIEYFGNEPEE